MKLKLQEKHASGRRHFRKIKEEFEDCKILYFYPSLIGIYKLNILYIEVKNIF